jgi:hypothetical protein
MKRLLFLLLFPLILLGQGQNFPSGGGGGLTQVATLPGTCTPGVTSPVQLSVSPGGMYYCGFPPLPANTWVQSSTPNGVIDPVAYGVKGGVLRCNGSNANATLTITSTSNAVTCSAWSPTNVTLQPGWTCFATNWNGADSGYITGPSALILPQTTVATVTGTGAFTTVANATGSTSGTNGTLFCGPQDDTTGLNAAGTSAFGGIDCLSLQLPGGYIFFSAALWQTAACQGGLTGTISKYGSINGQGPGGPTTLVPLPTFNYTGTTMIAAFQGAQVMNVSVDGGGQSVGGTHAVNIFSTTTDGTLQNLMCGGWLTNSATAVGLNIGGGYHIISNMTIDGCGNNAVFPGGGLAHGAIYAVFGGNTNAYALNVSGGGVFGCQGCFWQNSGGASSPVSITTGSTVYLDMDGCFAGGSATACYIINAATLYLSKTTIASGASPFNLVNALGANAIVHLRDNALTATGISSNATLTQAATDKIYDDGGNILFPSTGIYNNFGGVAGGFVPQKSIPLMCTGTVPASQTIGFYGTGYNVTTLACATTVGTGMVMDHSGTAGVLQLTASAGGVNASSGACTVMKATGAGALGATTVTATFGTGTIAVDGTHTFTFVSGDRISLQCTTQAVDTLANVGGSIAILN